MSQSQDLHNTLKQYFGFSDFRPGQVAVIDHLLAGRSSAAVFPTGGGKSLCYQLPALLLPGVTLVVSPLIALMKDQIDALATRGIAAQRLDSSLSADEYRNVMAQMRSGELRLLYVAPERFNNERFRETILNTRISLFAVDEAHCISEWGHNFRPDYLKLAEFAHLCGAERILGLTATATRQVLDDIRQAFDIAPECAIRTPFYRPNLTILTTPTNREDRDGYLLAQLQQRPVGPTIVYVTLQRTAEEVAARLAAAGLPARAYHAGMKDDARSEVQEWFLASSDGIVVATIAFGMGIDKSNIRYVYHYNLPKSLENYAQEIGRAGRDDAPSTCHLLACPDDLNTLENFVYGDTPTHEAVQGLLTEIFELGAESSGAEFDVSYYDLSFDHDIRILVVRTLLTYLELAGYLVGGTPFYATYRFKPLMSSQEILANFEGERRSFLTAIFRQAQKAKTWFDIDIDAATNTLQTPRERLVRALDYLGEQQMLEVRVAGVRNRYRAVRTPEDVSVLADRLYAQMVQRQDREIARLGQVLEWVQLDKCQTSALSAYFDDPLAQPCGHCSWCQSSKAATVPPRRVPTVEAGAWQAARSLQQERADILSSPVALARFLCGVTSPKISRGKLVGHPLFGRLADMPYSQVLEKVQQKMTQIHD